MPEETGVWVLVTLYVALAIAAACTVVVLSRRQR